MYSRFKEIIDNHENIVFFGGAGVSTESGIPDFRSENGLYHAMKAYNHSPEEMLSRSFFDAKTEIFYDYYKKNLIHLEAMPNQAHIALAQLERQGKLKAVITQNIDGLHQMAGSQKVWELHGSIMRNYCMKCHKKFTVEEIIKKQGIPKCDVCGGIIKPDVVLYEEPLNDQVVEGAIKAISQADVLIVGGTSLVVYPAAGLIDYFKGEKIILINKSKTSYDHQADLVINEAIGKIFEEIVLK